MANFAQNELVCTHPALDGRHRELWATSTYASQQLSGSFDFSYEMVMFLSRLNTGVDWSSQSAKRCLTAAGRKGCYKEPILHPMGFAAGATGERGILDAKIIQARILVWHRYHGTTLPPVDQTSTMDEIVVYGNLNLYSLRMLQLLWEMSPTKPQLNVAVPPVFHNWSLETVDIADETYVLLSSVRSNMHTRSSVETLVKFGLVDLVTLPKLARQNGRGRAPVGFTITDAGIRFFVDYLSNFSEHGKFLRDAAASAPNQTSDVSPPVESEMSDVVDGENLRELFG